MLTPSHGPAVFRLAAATTLLTLFAPPRAARAQTNDPVTELVNMMIQKGMLTEQEAQKVKADADALKAERAAAATNASSIPSLSKWKIADAVKSVELFGDLRFRFENREADAPGGRVELDRLRYALRLGLRGDLSDNFYYGLRLETASNPRSPWVTFGTSSSGAPYQGPFGKSTAALALGQIYLGWKPESWVDITLGKMPNPLFQTPMLWDTDINPEGLVERFKYTVGPADFFVSLGQYLYEDVNPVYSSAFIFPSIPHGQNTSLPFLLSWQAGVKYHVTQDQSAQIAVTLYNYTGHGTDTPPGTPPGTPGFADTFVGQGAGIPVNGASGYSSGPFDGFAFNQTGINDLLILDIPFQYDFKLEGLNARVFGDFAENLDGAQRAEAAVAAGLVQNSTESVSIPLQKNDNKAYQLGFGIGNGENLGLVYGSRARKGDWEARTYWQHVEQYSLDPNLIDSDFFEGRLNLQGLYTAFGYSFTDALSGTVRYGYATRINSKLGTGGSNQDIPQVNPIDKYQILQLDLSCKF